MDRSTCFVAMGVCGLVGLAGCVEGPGLGSSRPETAATAAADRPAATDLAESDVEAPDVFQRTEAGLWDGRPSLGGIWVAHPDVTDPERVIIRNTANGQTVIGALFRRERENPGPRIQVSSDAAAALGLIAGAPTQLNVTALKRAEPPKPAAAEEPAPEAEAVVAEDATSEADDAIAGASAAIARAEATETASPDPDGAGDDVAVAAEVASDEAEPRTARRGFLAGLFGARAAREPLSATVDVSAAALESPEVTTVALDAAEAAPTPPAAEPAAPVIAAEELPSASAQEAAQEAALTDPEIVEPAAEAPRQRRGFLGGLFAPRNAAPLSALDPSLTSSTAAPEEAAPTPATRGAYLEVGVFPTRDGADAAAASMRAAGVIPLIDERETADASAWRVLVGPATSREDRKALLHKVKGLGYEDASIVRR